MANIDSAISDKAPTVAEKVPAGNETTAFSGQNHPFNLTQDLKAVWNTGDTSPLLHDLEIVASKVGNIAISGEVAAVDARTKYPVLVGLNEYSGF